MNGIDTAGAEAIDATLRRIANWWRKRKTAKAQPSPAQYQWISDAITGRRNGDMQDDR